MAVIHLLDEDLQTRLDVARDPANSPRDLAILAEDSDKRVRLVLVNNPSVLTETLEKLAVDPVRKVRLSVVNHPNSSKAVIEKVVNYGHLPVKVLLKIAQIGDLTETTYIMIAQEFSKKYPEVSEAIKKL